jgi:fructose-1,6-bisphosphatase/inositol monophosphatase family enzyme
LERWIAAIRIALDPVDGTTSVSKGMPNSLSCIVAAQSQDGEPCLLDIPAFYMKKLAYPLAVRRAWIQDPSLPIHIDVLFWSGWGKSSYYCKLASSDQHDRVKAVYGNQRESEM